VVARTSYQAVRSFKDSMQKTASCVTDSVLRVSPGGYEESVDPHLLTFPDDPVALRGEGNLSLSVRHYYQVGRHGVGRRRHKVSTVAYYYQLRTQSGDEVIAFHWHPKQRSSVTFPHLHIGRGSGVKVEGFYKTHLPTPRVLLEDFLQLLLDDFGIQPNRTDWRNVLQEGREHFKTESTWR
jgi:hypothetical protein